MLVTAAVRLLKTEKLRGMVIDLETDGCFNQEQEEEKILHVLEHINEMINRAFNVVSQQPSLLPFYRKMIESAVATMPTARQFEAVMEEAFNKIAAELNAPNEPKIKPENEILTVQKQKNAQDYEIKKEQNELKREELNLKKAIAIADNN